ncbi:hypothetical protein [Clavibacter michiganensis]|uniref:hypothetical protein n=1 Tax=Clavibacter michiganensis TaxID=28447 RepID=UPI00355B08C9
MLEPPETPLACIVREVEEELGARLPRRGAGPCPGCSRTGCCPGGAWCPCPGCSRRGCCRGAGPPDAGSRDAGCRWRAPGCCRRPGAGRSASTRRGPRGWWTRPTSRPAPSPPRRPCGSPRPGPGARRRSAARPEPARRTPRGPRAPEPWAAGRGWDGRRASGPRNGRRGAARTTASRRVPRPVR